MGPHTKGNMSSGSGFLFLMSSITSPLIVRVQPIRSLAPMREGQKSLQSALLLSLPPSQIISFHSGLKLRGESVDLEKLGEQTSFEDT